MKEAELLYHIRRLSVGDVRLFRNNVGMLEDAYGNKVSYGLCVGSSDLIGWRRRVIQPIDVGCEWAVFCAVEVKGTRGAVSKPQQAFIDTVRSSGGLAGVARSLDEARKILRC